MNSRSTECAADFLFSSLGDLIGFEGYLNTTTPLSYSEHKGVWKSTRRYWDFDMTYEHESDCGYPRFWTETGEMVGRNVTDHLTTCLTSDFDQVRILAQHH